MVEYTYFSDQHTWCPFSKFLSAHLATSFAPITIDIYRVFWHSFIKETVSIWELYLSKFLEIIKFWRSSVNNFRFSSHLAVVFSFDYLSRLSSDYHCHFSLFISSIFPPSSRLNFRKIMVITKFTMIQLDPSSHSLSNLVVLIKYSAKCRICISWIAIVFKISAFPWFYLLIFLSMDLDNHLSEHNESSSRFIIKCLTSFTFSSIASKSLSQILYHLICHLDNFLSISSIVSHPTSSNWLQIQQNHIAE